MRRILLLFPAAIGLITIPATAGPRDDAVSGVSRCAGIADDRIWLNCFYGAAQPMRAHLGLPPAPAAQTQLVPPGPANAVATAPAPAAPQKKRQGFFSSLFSDLIQTRMENYRFDDRGLFTVTLENGVVWRQSPNDSNRAHWKESADHYAVSINDMVNEDATMIVEKDGRRYQVQRAH